MGSTETIKQDRFIQRDPFGIRDGICIIEFTPTGSPAFPRGYNSLEQYIDGMSLYEYVKSKPVKIFDTFGLRPTFIIPKTPRVCCQVRKTRYYRTRKPDANYYMPTYTGILPHTSCFQKTRLNNKGLTPMAACKCLYKVNNSYSRYDTRYEVLSAKRGDCCWCSVSYVAVKNIFRHAYIEVNCKGTVNDWIADAHPDQPTSNPGKEIVVCNYLLYDKDVDKSPMGHISCEAAAYWKEKLNGRPWDWNVGPGNCWSFARHYIGIMKDSCEWRLK